MHLAGREEESQCEHGVKQTSVGLKGRMWRSQMWGIFARSMGVREKLANRKSHRGRLGCKRDEDS